MSDRARVTLRVAAPREIAFEVFTTELDAWWRHGRAYRVREPSTMRLEAGVGGKLTETWTDSRGARTREIGVVQVWDPPRRLVVTWRAANFTDADPSTEVEVTFERAIGHAGEGTLVVLEHRGWSRVRPDHPARHGQAPSLFLASLGQWWGALGSALREHVTSRG